MCTFSPSDIDLMTLSSSSCIFYNYLHISNVSLRAHYSVMSSVLLLARVQPSGVLVWKKPSWKMCAWCCRLSAQMQTREKVCGDLVPPPPHPPYTTPHPLHKFSFQHFSSTSLEFCSYKRYRCWDLNGWEKSISRFKVGAIFSLRSDTHLCF